MIVCSETTGKPQRNVKTLQAIQKKQNLEEARVAVLYRTDRIGSSTFPNGLPALDIALTDSDRCHGGRPAFMVVLAAPPSASEATNL